MIPIYICEDDKHQLNNWVRIIEDYLLLHPLDETLVCAVSTPQELLEDLEQRKSVMGLYFLDICLNADLNGLQLAAKIRSKDPLGEIVFITSRSEMCSLTYEYQVGALDFIIKDLTDSLPTKIKRCMETAAQKARQIKALSTEPLYLKLGGERIRFNPDDILYIETSKDAVHKIIIYTKTGMETAYGSLKEMEAALEKFSDFCRCHKSIIVNKKNIQKSQLKSRELVLTTGAVIPVSTRYMRSLD